MVTAPTLASQRVLKDVYNSSVGHVLSMIQSEKRGLGKKNVEAWIRTRNENPKDVVTAPGPVVVKVPLCKLVSLHFL